MANQIAKTEHDGRTPKLWQIRPDKLSEIEEAAREKGVLAHDAFGEGNRTIFGIPYEPILTPHGQGVLLTYTDTAE